MELFVNTSQPVIIHMSVDLGGFDVGVAEHFLQGPQVRTAGEQMGRKTVPKCVDGQVFRHAGTDRIFFDNTP